MVVHHFQFYIKIFQVQLILGKYILPLFGGVPAVWNTCMFFFQVLLLLGYAYAHIVGSKAKPRVQGRIHGALLIASLAIVLVLWAIWGSPLTPGVGWRPKPGENPVWKILELLSVTCLLPFFVLSTTAPLLQRWFSRNYSDRSPYPLYVLSNAGSLLGLLSYPFLIEPLFTLKHQAWLWSAGYAVFVLFCAFLAWDSSKNPDSVFVRPSQNTSKKSAVQTPTLAHYFLWVGLSTCSTTVLLATTNLLCQDLAVIPLLWVAPLSVYLISFIFTFSENSWYRRRIFWPLYFVALGLGTRPEFLGQAPIPLLWVLGACGMCLFAVCMVCHGELVRAKPSPEHLTSFYLAIAIGGALGGAFVVFIAPHLFLGFFEFQTAVIACGILLFAAFLLEDRTGSGEKRLWDAALLISLQFILWDAMILIRNSSSLRTLHYALQLLLGLLVIGRLLKGDSIRSSTSPDAVPSPWRSVAALLAIGVLAAFSYGFDQVVPLQILFRERNFFGIKIIDREDAGENARLDLISGVTVHGSQFVSPAKRNTPTVYYKRESGIGLLLGNYPRTSLPGSRMRIGLIGMGAGTLAAYGQAGDYLRFYEIDPAVPALSTGPNPYFHFAQDSPANVEVVLGDARLLLENEAARGELQRFNVLVVDAFSGDSIPVHLLTEEAMNVYRQHLSGPDSVIAFHVSNRYLDLRPVIAGLAERFHLGIVQVTRAGTWILLSANPAMLQLPNLREKAQPLVLEKGAILWTDNYSNLIQILHARDR